MTFEGPNGLPVVETTSDLAEATVVRDRDGVLWGNLGQDGWVSLGTWGMGRRLAAPANGLEDQRQLEWLLRHGPLEVLA